jgi:hypothetical protein
LRSELIESIHRAAFSATESERSRLITTLEELLPLDDVLASTSAIDALKALGALDSDEENHISVVQANVAEALSDPDAPEMQQLAATLWNCQFDHPYDGAYCRVWNALGAEQRKILLTMAAKAVETDSWLASVLVASLASLNDPSVAPLIARWAALPDIQSVHPGESIQAFVMAYAALARLGVDLPRPAGDLSSAANALTACGEIIYWLNRIDIALAERRAACAEAFSILSGNADGVAADAIYQLKFSNVLFDEAAKELPGSKPVLGSFVGEFPEAVADIFRNALRRPTEQRGYFAGFRVGDLLSSCLAALGEIGTTADIELLRPYTQVPNLGSVAMDAIRRLEGVRGESVNRLAG